MDLPKETEDQLHLLGLLCFGHALNYDRTLKARGTTDPVTCGLYHAFSGTILTVGTLFGIEAIDAIKRVLREQGAPYPESLDELNVGIKALRFGLAQAGLKAIDINDLLKPPES